MDTTREKIDRLKKALGVSKNYEVADILGISRNQISHWATREKVPEKYLLEVSKKSGCNIRWLDTGEGEMRGGGEEEVGQDTDTWRTIIETVEEHLQSNNLQLRPDKKADLIVTLYEMFTEEEKQVDKKTVAKLIKLAI